MLQRNNGRRPDGSPSFSDVARLAGVHQTDWSWSVLFADFDNDARKDLFVSNGIPKDITNNDYIKFRDTEAARAGSYDEVKRELLEHLDALPDAHHSNYLFRNEGDLRFSDQSAAWGITEATCSNGAAYADLDQDGDLDLVVNHLNQPTEIFENQSQRRVNHHYLRIRLHADSTVDLVGTEVQITHGDQQQLLSHNPYRGFQSSVEETLHFGLGADTLVTTVTVRWTDGRVQTWNDIAANQEVTLRQQSSSSGQDPVATDEPTNQPLFRAVTDEAGIAFVHQENEFNDFKANPLLPWQYDQSGPCLATGDVNGDGRDDFFVGGSATYAGTLFLQQAGGTFTPKKLPNPEFEDTDALFFDADQDGDLDLYVVSGGSEYTHPKAHQDRLYRNDGRGNFTRQPEALPPIGASGTCVVAADYDQDGDQDLFVGGGILPDQYPRCSRSYVLENTRGRFTDVTARVHPQLQRPGIVTAARWTDLNQDERPDLLVVGEWMPIRVFVNQGGVLFEPNRPVANWPNPRLVE